MSNTHTITAGVNEPRIRKSDDQRIYLTLKRSMDITIAAFALVFLSPLLILVSLAIKRDSSGPALFTQTRVGLNGKHFKIWKFRTMCTDAEEQKTHLKEQNEMNSGVLFKVKQDPRITGLGRILRKYSIDELPQLVNVLKGEMSLVGPRPALPEEVSQYNHMARKRLNAIPGLTCFWQVSGRSNLDFDQQVRLDLEYVEKSSLLTDIDLLIRTVPAVLFARGAY